MSWSKFSKNFGAARVHAHAPRGTLVQSRDLACHPLLIEDHAFSPVAHARALRAFARAIPRGDLAEGRAHRVLLAQPRSPLRITPSPRGPGLLPPASVAP